MLLEDVGAGDCSAIIFSSDYILLMWEDRIRFVFHNKVLKLHRMMLIPLGRSLQLHQQILWNKKMKINVQIRSGNFFTYTFRIFSFNSKVLLTWLRFGSGSIRKTSKAICAERLVGNGIATDTFMRLSSIPNFEKIWFFFMLLDVAFDLLYCVRTTCVIRTNREYLKVTFKNFTMFWIFTEKSFG